ncbi:MAG TPA: hypothetical protein VMF90_12145 [Rhizobiaceae bacterium]|nr:hypothetical protein [Rhizobiaceae bacterium]
MRPLCIYHGNCADGFTAAWVVHSRFGDEFEFHPGVYANPPPDVTGRDVLLVDFSYKYDVLHQMARAAATVLVLDHHKTAAEDLSKLPPPLDGQYNPNAMRDWQRECNSPNALHALFDMERSGAQIAWDYFNPGQKRPNLVNYVGDRDLWRFALPQSREVNAFIFAHEYTFRNWNYLDAMTRDHMGLQDVADRGGAIELKHHKDIAELLEQTKRTMVIGGHAVPVANLPYTMSSDAAGTMAEGQPFAACYFDKPGARVFSLRSKAEGLDVSAIAKAYGGGGHRNAAGFQAPLGWEGESAS